MQSTDQPDQVQIPFANTGTKRPIPVPSQIGITDGAASFTDGFPPKTFLPLAVGGIPPAGADFNGILFDITQIQQWQSAGGMFKFNSIFAAAIGGYPLGARIMSDTGAIVYINGTENNSTNPNTGGAGWTVIKEREYVSAFDNMSAAQIAAVLAYTFVTDVTATMQAGMNAAFAADKDYYMPAGGYLVTGLLLPGTAVGPDTRTQSFRFYGQGCGNPFAVSAYSGSTVLKSATNAPILTDNPIVSANSNCSIEIDNIKFDGNSASTPVVLMNTMYGVSSMHHFTIYQRGDGDGFKLTYGGTCAIHDGYSFNADFVASGLGASRTGVGFNFINNFAAGLVSFRNVTSRGFKDGYIFDGINSTEKAYSVTLDHFECSTLYNGVTVGANCTGVVINDGYFEGMDNGTAITVLYGLTTITNNRIYAGSLIGIDASGGGALMGGLDIHSNLVNIGNKVNGIGISLQSSGNTRNQNCENNTIIYVAGTAGVNGIKIQGTDPRMNVMGNYFEPGNIWTGAASKKINDLSVNGVLGLIQGEVETGEIVTLSRGAISLLPKPTAFVQADVVGNVLTLPEVGSSFICSATGAASVNKFAAGVVSGRHVMIRTTTANMSFVDSAYIQTAAGAAFTGPGVIVFSIDRIGADNYAWEVSRTVF